MNTGAGQAIALWPLVVYAIMVLGLVASMLILSWLLGQRHRDHATNEPYESGVAPTGSARQRLSANFYLMAMFFLIFDLEAVFIFAWAVAAREVSWIGYLGVFCFIGVLIAGLLYEWRMGALDWAVRLQQPKVIDRQARYVNGDRFRYSRRAVEVNGKSG